MNPLVAVSFAVALMFSGMFLSVSISESARYACIAEVSKTQDVSKAKELCK